MSAIWLQQIKLNSLICLLCLIYLILTYYTNERFRQAIGAKVHLDPLCQGRSQEAIR